MPTFYINAKQLVFSNKHDIHVRTCYFFPSEYEIVGDFFHCELALEKAQELYAEWEIIPCPHCCQPCIEHSDN